MLRIIKTKSFLQDLKRAKRRNLNINDLNFVVNKLACNEQLDPKYKDHALKGSYIGLRECHIHNDWLLVYRIDNKTIELILFRTGTHADLNF